jgi:hypothetical protein
MYTVITIVVLCYLIGDTECSVWCIEGKFKPVYLVAKVLCGSFALVVIFGFLFF